MKELCPVYQTSFQVSFSTFLTVPWAEQRELFSGQEPQLHPAEKIIHDGLCVPDLRVAGPAGGLKPSMLELVAEHFQWHSVLKADRNHGAEALHQSGNG